MISHSEFYNRLLKAKEKEALLKEREVKALESIADSLKIISDKWLKRDSSQIRDMRKWVL